MEMRGELRGLCESLPEGHRPWPPTLVATFRRRGALAWQDLGGWRADARVRWDDARAITWGWFGYAVGDVDLGDEPDSTRKGLRP